MAVKSPQAQAPWLKDVQDISALNTEPTDTWLDWNLGDVAGASFLKSEEVRAFILYISTGSKSGDLALLSERYGSQNFALHTPRTVLYAAQDSILVDVAEAKAIHALPKI